MVVVAGHPAILDVLDALIAALVRSSQNPEEQWPLSRSSYGWPASIGINGWQLGQATDKQRTASLQRLSAMSQDPRPWKTWPQLARQQQLQQQQQQPPPPKPPKRQKKRRTDTAINLVGDSLAFMCDSQPGLVVPFAWSTAGGLYAAPPDSDARRLSEAAVLWLGWYLSAATGEQEREGLTATSDSTERQLQVDSSVYTADLVRRAVSGPDGNGDEQQRLPGDKVASVNTIPFVLQAYGWLAQSRYVLERKSTSQPTRAVSFTKAMASLLKHNAHDDRDTGDAAAATASAVTPVSDTLSLPPDIARAVLDLVHEWLNEAQAYASTDSPSTSWCPFPDGFWVAVVDHLNKFWAEPELQPQGKPEQLRRESAITLLKRMAAPNVEAVVGKGAVDAAKTALSTASA
jgi:hypothetical protein